MRQLIIIIIPLTMVLLEGSGAHSQVMPSFNLRSIPPQSIPVTTSKMTTLLFPAAIRTGVKVSRGISVQKVKNVENVLVLKARYPDFQATNLDVFGRDGRCYSFDVRYVQDPSVLNFQVLPAPGGGSAVGGVPVLLAGIQTDDVTLKKNADSIMTIQGFLHHSVRSESVRLSLKGLFIKDGMLWFSGRLQNFSNIPYTPAYCRLFVRDKKRLKSSAIQEIDITPLYSSLPLSVEKDRAFVLGYPIFTIPKHKRLVLEVAEKNGGRFLRLIVRNKALLKAKKI